MTWKKIGSAPKDGSFVILYVPSEENPIYKICVGHWCSVTKSWFNINGSYGYQIIPTHWMYLPDPPKEPS